MNSLQLATLHYEQENALAQQTAREDREETFNDPTWSLLGYSDKMDEIITNPFYL